MLRPYSNAGAVIELFDRLAMQKPVKPDKRTDIANHFRLFGIIIINLL